MCQVREPFGKRPPLAAVLEYVQDPVEGSAVGYFDGIAVFRERVCYELVLFLCYFHMIMVSHQCNLREQALVSVIQ